MILSISPNSCLRNAIAYFMETQGTGFKTANKVVLFKNMSLYTYCNPCLFINEHFFNDKAHSDLTFSLVTLIWEHLNFVGKETSTWKMVFI